MALAIQANNVLLDLFPDTRLATKDVIFEVGEISKTKGGYSEQFQIPLTEANIATLGYVTISNLDSDAVNPYQYISANLLDDNLIIKSGVIQIDKVDEFDKIAFITFFDNNTFLNQLVKNKSIRDLDFSEFDHNWSDADILASWANTSGYVYVPINHGNQWATTSTNQIDGDELYPSTFIHTILRKIIEGAGFTLSGSLLNDVLYNKTTVSFSQEDFSHSENWKNQRQFFVNNLSNQSFAPAAVTDTFTINFGNETVAPAFDNGDNFSDPTYTADQTQTGNMGIYLGGTYIQPGGDTATIQFWLYKNGAQDTLLATKSFTATFEQWFMGLITPYSASGADQYEVRAYVSAISASGAHTLTILQDRPEIASPLDRCRFFNRVDTDIAVDGTVELNRTLPDISQSDFLNEVFFRFQVVPEVDTISQEVNLEMFKDIKTKIGKYSVDWSLKLDLSKNYGFELMQPVQDYGKINLIKQQVDDNSDFIKAINNDLPRPLGFGVIEVNNDFLSEEEEIFESEAYPFTNEDAFVSGGERLDLPAHRRDNELRFMVYFGQASIPSLSFQTISTMTIAGSVVSEMAWGYFEKRDFADEDIDGFRQTLSFESNILNDLRGTGLKEVYFEDIIRILQQPRLFRGFLQLNNLDRHNFKFVTPVYLDTGKEDGYFYVNKLPENIIGSNDSIEVELIKLI